MTMSLIVSLNSNVLAEPATLNENGESAKEVALGAVSTVAVGAGASTHYYFEAFKSTEEMMRKHGTEVFNASKTLTGISPGQAIEKSITNSVNGIKGAEAIEISYTMEKQDYIRDLMKEKNHLETLIKNESLEKQVNSVKIQYLTDTRNKILREINSKSTIPSTVSRSMMVIPQNINVQDETFMTISKINEKKGNVVGIKKLSKFHGYNSLKLTSKYAIIFSAVGGAVLFGDALTSGPVTKAVERLRRNSDNNLADSKVVQFKQNPLTEPSGSVQ
jgi:hypothetical protein